MSRRPARQLRGRRYGFFNFFVDVVMCIITGGLWLIWIAIREFRGR